MSEPQFSVCVITKDEGESLPRLLASLQEFRSRGGQIVVVDNGSKDATPLLAKQMGADLLLVGDAFQFEVDAETTRAINRRFVIDGDAPVMVTGTKLFDYGAARNFAAWEARHDLIINPDADEAFTRLNVDALDALASSGLSRLHIDFVDQHDEDGRPTNRFISDSRVYDRRLWHWRGTMHETLEPRAESAGPTAFAQVRSEDCLLEHYQRSSSNRERYLAALAYAAYFDPTNARQAHCLGRQMMYEARYASAVHQFVRHAVGLEPSE
jgi:glycosyltransferase involved in cell wall biosynthesis